MKRSMEGWRSGSKDRSGLDVDPVVPGLEAWNGGMQLNPDFRDLLAESRALNCQDS
jgi:hypothetical protein